MNGGHATRDRAWLTGLVLVFALFLPTQPGTAAEGRISIAELQKSNWSGGLVDNGAFFPGADAQETNEPFNGTMRIDEVEMTTTPSTLKARRVLGRDTKIFPAVTISFVTVAGDLVPTTQDVLRVGSIGKGRSYWDVIVQPGRIWAEKGEEPWSRAALPFGPPPLISVCTIGWSHRWDGGRRVLARTEDRYEHLRDW
jgi:hypothetical protein